MKIVVLVKQVPEVTQVQVNPETGTLIREGVKSILNPFCEYALDHAVRLAKEVENVEIIALSMGPPQARAALIRCLELGAQRAILVSDRAFAGADTWATALTLAGAVRLAVPDYDLIFAGKQAIDGDTAQVGPELAEILGIPQITFGVQASLYGGGKKIRVRQEVEGGYDVLETVLPALVTFSKGEVVRRAPSFLDVAQAREKPLQVLSAKDLGIPEEQIGLKGSFTQVVRVFAPSGKEGCRLVQNLEAEQAAQEILAFLLEKKFLARGGGGC